MPTNKGKRNAAVRRLPERGVLAIATTTTLHRRSGRGTAPTAPAADVTGTGGAAAADTGTVGAAAATVNTSSRHSGCNTIAVSDAAASTTSSVPNAGSTINAPSSGPARFSGHSQPSINTVRNLDIHDAASLPVPAILDDNIQYTAAVKLIHLCLPSPQRKQTPIRTNENSILFKDQLEGRQKRTVNHLLDAQASLTSPSLFAKTTGDKGFYFSTSHKDDDYIPEEDARARTAVDVVCSTTYWWKCAQSGTRPRRRRHGNGKILSPPTASS